MVIAQTMPEKTKVDRITAIAMTAPGGICSESVNSKNRANIPVAINTMSTEIGTTRPKAKRRLTSILDCRGIIEVVGMFCRNNLSNIVGCLSFFLFELDESL